MITATREQLDEDEEAPTMAANTEEANLMRNRITDEGVALMRRRIGYANPTVRSGTRQLPWWTVTSSDAIRHHTNGYGDDNPLYCDPEYGTRTRWGAQIAPPGFTAGGGPRAAQVPLPPEYGDEDDVPPGDEQAAWLRRLGKRPTEAFDRETRSALRGVQLYASGGDSFYYRPFYPGDYVAGSAGGISNVEDKQSEFAGRSVIVTNRHVSWNQRGEITSMGEGWLIHAERRKATSDNKYAKDEAAFYTDEQLDEIDAAYENEYQRGADTLYWEDVEVGAELPTMVKGPLSVTDMINQHMGGGWFGYGNPALRLGYENRKRMRGFYTKNRFNAWDVVQRVHWEQELAQEVGVPLMYDIAPMRAAWVTHYCTNFMGDDAWLFHVHNELRRFNFFGDTTWFRATVSDKYDSPEIGPAIDIEITGTNQRGKPNCQASATILLASRAKGPVVLPEPPVDIRQRVNALIDEQVRRQHTVD
jgi:acyl dehydratase